MQADRLETFGGLQRVRQQLLHDMEAGGLPLGIVGVARMGSCVHALSKSSLTRPMCWRYSRRQRQTYRARIPLLRLTSSLLRGG